MGNCRRIIEKVLDLLFPPRCPVCDQPVPVDEGLICRKCQPKMKYIKDPRCRKCGKQLGSEHDIFCQDCNRKSHDYQYGFALYDYQSVQNSIFRFKYQKRAEYSRYYGYDMCKNLWDEIKAMQADAIIPIPLHREREKIRGYNQAQEIARVISEIMDIPMYANLVKRVKNTVPQKKLDEFERQNNLKNAFHIQADDVKLKRVILVDDIYTTGSTIDAVSKELRRHGVGEIYFLTLSIGEGM